MTKKAFSWLILPALAGLCLAWSCNKSDFENAGLGDHESEFAFPLFTTSLTLQDLMSKVLNDTLSGDTLFVNADNTMTLFYTGDVAEKPASDIFNFLSQGIIPLFDSVGSAPIQAPAGVTVKQAFLKSGTITLGMSNSTQDTLTGYFEIPQMSMNGQVFQYPLVLPPNGSNIWLSPFIDLTGQLLNSNSNTLQFKYFLYKSDGTRVKLPSFYVVSFQNLQFSYMEGYFGYSAYPLTRDTIEIDINQTDLDAGVKVKNPKVTMTVANSWGFPTRGVVKYLSFIGQNGEEYKLETTAFNNDSVDFAYPPLSAVGEVRYTEITLDEHNSNIADIFNAQPTRLIYEVEGISNAMQNPNLIGFLTDSSNISLGVRVELLLEGAAKNFGAEQTVNLDFGDYGTIDTSKVGDVEFKLATENGTPISAKLQLVFLDDNSGPIDSLFQWGVPEVIRSAPVNSEGVADGIIRTETFIPMTSSRFNRIRQSKKALMRTSFTTAEGGEKFVKLLATDKVTIKMGVKVKAKL